MKDNFWGHIELILITPGLFESPASKKAIVSTNPSSRSFFARLLLALNLVGARTDHTTSCYRNRRGYCVYRNRASCLSPYPSPYPSDSSTLVTASPRSRRVFLPFSSFRISPYSWYITPYTRFLAHLELLHPSALSGCPAFALQHRGNLPCHRIRGLHR